ncbi:hypothetical protein RB195_023728 [Necator americanus]|uniref:Uncharacterized protein n=1 Tax=Necator americanus TaxID=51031 RepID=A0ABR1EL63_NECAM
MMNDMTPAGQEETSGLGNIQEHRVVVKKTRNTRFRAHLSITVILPALTYASETWTLPKEEESAVRVIERRIERVMLEVSRFTQVKEGFEVHSYVKGQRSEMLLHIPIKAKLRVLTTIVGPEP